MDPVTNPYSPGAGHSPPELAGRDTIIENVSIALERIRLGRPTKSVLMVGLRGVGKTVLLDHLKIIAETKAEMQAELDVATAKADAEIAAKAAESEKAIAAIREGAMESVKAVAEDAAKEIVATLGGKYEAHCSSCQRRSKYAIWLNVPCEACLVLFEP